MPKLAEYIKFRKLNTKVFYLSTLNDNETKNIKLLWNIKQYKTINMSFILPK